MMAAYVEYAYRWKSDKSKNVYFVDCSLSDLPRRWALLLECDSVIELLWARVAGSLV